MFGSEYANHPEILMQSLHEMNAKYQKPRCSANMLGFFQSIYIRLFGIPEIGFQIRGMYFRKALWEMRDFKPKKILDAGSGIGSYTFYLAKLFPNASVEGWEIDKNKLAFCKKFSKELNIRNAPFSFRNLTNTLGYKSKFDLIVNIDVLEHIKDYKKVLKNFYTLLMPGGYVYIHTPQLNQKRFFSRFDTWKHKDHVREGFDPITLRRDLMVMGFGSVSMRHTFGIIGSLAWEINHMLLSKSLIFAGILYPLVFLLSCIDAVVPNKRGLCLSVVAQKKVTV